MADKSTDIVKIHRDGYTMPEKNAKKVEEMAKKARKSGWTSFPLPFRYFYFWLGPLIRLGNYRTILETDLPDISRTELSENLRPPFMKAWKQEMETCNGDPSLWRVIWKLHWVNITTISLCEALYFTSSFFTPYIIQNLSEFFRDSSKGIDRDPWEGFLYSFLLGSITWMMCIFDQYYYGNLTILGTRLRVSAMAAIFEKALTVDPDELKSHSSGEVLNLMSNDAQRLYECLTVTSMIWTYPLVILIAMVLLYFELGYAAFVAIGLMLLLFPYQLLMANLMQKTRQAVLVLTDQRVKLVNEMLQGIRVIKLYAWEEAVARTLSEVRRKELRWTRIGLLLRIMNHGILFIWPTVVTLATMIIYTKIGNELTETKVLLMLAFLNITRYPILLIPTCLTLLVDLRIALRRLARYLSKRDLPSRIVLDQREEKQAQEHGQEHAQEHGQQREEYQRFRSHVHPNSHPHGNHYDNPTQVELTSWNTRTMLAERFAIYCSNASFRWSRNDGPATLASINLAVAPGTLTAVIGPVGIGKSSLISALLGEMHAFEDNQCAIPNPNLVLVKGFTSKTSQFKRVGYLAQDPWIIHGSLKQNILLDLPLDEGRLIWAINVSALCSDIDILSDGIDTVIGESGVNLSGGQKARVAMARLMYRCHEVNVCLLDDPLSAVDMGVGKHIFEKCILELKRQGKTVILTLNSHLHILELVDSIVVLDSLSTALTMQRLLLDSSLADRLASGPQSRVLSHSGKGDGHGDGQGQDSHSNRFHFVQESIFDVPALASISITDTGKNNDNGDNVDELDEHHHRFLQLQTIQSQSKNPLSRVDTDSPQTSLREPSTIIAHDSYAGLMKSAFDFSRYQQQLDQVDESELDLESDLESDLDLQSESDLESVTGLKQRDGYVSHHEHQLPLLNASQSTTGSAGSIEVEDPTMTNISMDLLSPQIAPDVHLAALSAKRTKTEKKRKPRKKTLGLEELNEATANAYSFLQSSNTHPESMAKKGTEQQCLSLKSAQSLGLQSSMARTVTLNDLDASSASGAGDMIKLRPMNPDTSTDKEDDGQDNGHDKAGDGSLALTATPTNTLGVETNTQGKISLQTYLSYFAGGGGTVSLLTKIFFMSLIAIACQAVKTMVDFWILWWAADSPETVLSHHTESWWVATLRCFVKVNYGTSTRNAE